MSLKQTIEIFELLDDSTVSGEKVKAFLEARGARHVTVTTVEGEKGSTDFVRVVIPGQRGKVLGGKAPTLAIVGRLGGIGARPERIGLVSDGDGAIAAMACALKLADMQTKGDILPGDVIISTHICPHAPTRPHHPVAFMDSPVDILTVNRHEVSQEMDAILSIDTTKGNRLFNHRGIAISPTVKEGYILKFSDDLINLLEMSTGQPAHTFGITMQDITPYGNGLYHVNSILQPAVATAAPVVGVAITAETVVPGCATGASHEVDIALAVKFSLEVAKAFGDEQCAFYDPQEFARMQQLYGSMAHLQTLGKSLPAAGKVS
ncbi:DUF1177 domain-containing protein [Ktedonosporobacter rubrisoli]|uniref:DUF1177 domain-containing protein n=1 Tax=Ktedonosporobacter rubrisoli TaxID=2509675 RepID=A0A4P6K098_KTERU|nr:DUF1177 domain-containing protein [Ktedonosporobacter rubrisoli]QBD80816.1 DUF1177 domain-containing protein [Ktedonosporobacter rubrisoli]